MAQRNLEFKTKKPKLTPHTEKLISYIEDDEIRDLLMKGLHPHEVVEGWYYQMASGILRIQKKSGKV